MSLLTITTDCRDGPVRITVAGEIDMVTSDILCQGIVGALTSDLAAGTGSHWYGPKTNGNG